jgi:hypothetical protein
MACGTKIYITSRIPRAFLYSNKAGTWLGPQHIRALHRAYFPTAFLAQSSRPHTLSLTNTYLHPRPFHDAESEAYHACMGRSPAFRLGGTRECCSARAICADGYGPLRKDRNLIVLVHVNTHARTRSHTRSHTHARTRSQHTRARTLTYT